MKREIIPSEKKHPRLIKKIQKLDKELPSPPFYLVLQGSVGSGKSSLLYSLIKAYQSKKFFDVIYIWNRVSDSDSAWEKFETDKTAIEIFHHYHDNDVFEIIENIDKVQKNRRAKKKPPLSILMVFDDMAYSNISRKGKPSALDEVVINRRHYNISLIITSQTYKALNQNMRTNNLSHLILLRANLRDLRNIAEEHNAGMVEEEEFIQMYQKVKEGDKYGFLVVDYQAEPSKIFKKNFKEIIQIDRD